MWIAAIAWTIAAASVCVVIVCSFVTARAAHRSAQAAATSAAVANDIALALARRTIGDIALDTIARIREAEQKK